MTRDDTPASRWLDVPDGPGLWWCIGEWTHGEPLPAEVHVWECDGERHWSACLLGEDTEHVGSWRLTGARWHRAEPPADIDPRDARIAALEGALREVCEARRSRPIAEKRWCLHCGVTWGTQHVATCPFGRGLRVLGGGTP